jgi:hypothetical protein
MKKLRPDYRNGAFFHLIWLLRRRKIIHRAFAVIREKNLMKIVWFCHRNKHDSGGLAQTSLSVSP